MGDLDQARVYESLDPQGMGALIAHFPGDCEKAWQQVQAFDLPSSYRDVDRLAVLGMGGSAIGGDLLRTLVADQCRVPILVSREYEVPAWVDARTLAIASSLSGNTEETLSAFEGARARGAKLMVMTTGGELEKAARVAGVPSFIYEFKGQPRAALGYSLVPLIGIVSRLGWIADPTAELERAIAGVRTLQGSIHTDTPEAQNPAKQLARRLFGRLPVIYGAGILGEVAHRWKTQVNENAKTIASYEAMSELNHNAVVGYEHPREGLGQSFFVLLTSPRANPRIRRRFEVTRELLDQRGLHYHVLQVEGESALAEMLWAIHFGDWVSYYLALLNGTDPMPVEAIDYLKNALKA